MKYNIGVSVLSKKIDINNLKLLSENLSSEDELEIFFYVNPQNEDTVKQLKKIKFCKKQIYELILPTTDDNVMAEFLCVNINSNANIFLSSNHLNTSYNTILKMIEENKAGADIVTIKPTKINFFQKILNKLISIYIKLVFSSKLYAGSVDVLLFSHDISLLFITMHKKSLKLSKLDNFIGYKKSVIESNSFKPTKYPVPKSQIVKLSLFASGFSIFLCLYILLLIFIPSVNIIYFHVIFLILIMVCTFFSIHYVFNVCLYKALGPLQDKYTPMYIKD